MKKLKAILEQGAKGVADNVGQFRPKDSGKPGTAKNRSFQIPPDPPLGLKAFFALCQYGALIASKVISLKS